MMRADEECNPEERLRQARRKVEHLIGTRERSEAELRVRLMRAGFDEALTERVLDEARVSNLVDDARFIHLYIAGKKRSGWGRIRIERGLTRYGIELRSHEGYPQAFFTDEDEIDRARSCLERFHSRAKDQRVACYHHLMAKGFSAETTHKVLLGSTE
jgi:regulatory protein